MDKKTCSICNTEYPIEQFHKKRSGHSHRCKLCEKAYQQKYYTDNRIKRINTAREHSKKRIEIIRKYVVDYLLKNPCIDCGESNILTLQFDHRENKEFTISIMVSSQRPVGMTKLKNEIDKCDVRCANCHQIKTANSANWWKLQYLSSE